MKLEIYQPEPEKKEVESKVVFAFRQKTNGSVEVFDKKSRWVLCCFYVGSDGKCHLHLEESVGFEKFATNSVGQLVD